VKRIAELVVHVSNLFEAHGRSVRETVRTEGRELRRNVGKVSTTLVGLLTSVILFAAGAAFLFAGLYLGLEQVLGAPGAAAITGAVCLAAGGTLLWILRQTIGT